jgi:hypothetical protein
MGNSLVTPSDDHLEPLCNFARGGVFELIAIEDPPDAAPLISWIDSAIDMARQQVDRRIERELCDFMRRHRTHRMNIRFEMGSPQIVREANSYRINWVSEMKIWRIKPRGGVAPLP